MQTKVESYLHNHNVATLATGIDGDVWAAAVFYVNEGFTLYFLSSPTSRHILNLAKSPRVALTVQEDYSDWLKIKGVQMEGIAKEISGIEEKHAIKMYGEKFPVVGLPGKAPLSIVSALSRICWYKLLPHRIYFIDNSRGLGHREEVFL
ncbi:MAG: pyridoxamine 5'-phosphate oxidase family protein [Desulfuromonadales bacterium]